MNIHYIMWVKQCHKPSPSHHHVYRWYCFHSQSWVVYDIVLPTLDRLLRISSDDNTSDDVSQWTSTTCESTKKIWINGHSRILNWRYLPYIKAYFSGLCKGISPENMAWNMVLTVLTYLHLGSWNSHWMEICNGYTLQNDYLTMGIMMVNHDFFYGEITLCSRLRNNKFTTEISLI